MCLCTYTIALTPRQYLSHILRNRGWPPISHSCRNTKHTFRTSTHTHILLQKHKTHTSRHTYSPAQMENTHVGTHVHKPLAFSTNDSLLKSQSRQINIKVRSIKDRDHRFASPRTPWAGLAACHRRGPRGLGGKPHPPLVPAPGRPAALTLMVTLPLVIFLMLKPTVGIMSSLNCPD